MQARALDQVWVRRVVVRRLLYCVGLVCLGALLLLSFALLRDHYGAASAELRRHGGQVEGQVLTLYEGGRYADGAATVGYTANGHQLTGEVGLGWKSRHYRSGQTVHVFYDVARPSHMTIDDLDNQPPWVVYPMVMLLVGGAFLLVGGGVWLNTTRRCRSLLAHAAWHRVKADIETQGSGRHARTWVSWEAGHRLRLTGNPLAAGVGRDRSIDIVERGRHAVIGLLDTQQLRSARVPRRWSRPGK